SETGRSGGRLPQFVQRLPETLQRLQLHRLVVGGIRPGIDGQQALVGGPFLHVYLWRGFSQDSRVALQLDEQRSFRCRKVILRQKRQRPRRSPHKQGGVIPDGAVGQ